MTSPTPDEPGVTVINKFIVPPKAMDEFLAEFERHRSLLSAQDGFLYGALYRKSAGTGRFNLVNFAVWKSLGDLEAARNTIGDYYAEHGDRPDSRYRDLGVEMDIASYETLVRY